MPHPFAADDDHWITGSIRERPPRLELGSAGWEPATLPLRYGRERTERSPGVAPGSSEWRTETLLLSYDREKTRAGDVNRTRFSGLEARGLDHQTIAREGAGCAGRTRSRELQGHALSERSRQRAHGEGRTRSASIPRRHPCRRTWAEGNPPGIEPGSTASTTRASGTADRASAVTCTARAAEDSLTLVAIIGAATTNLEQWTDRDSNSDFLLAREASSLWTISPYRTSWSVRGSNSHSETASLVSSRWTNTP